MQIPRLVPGGRPRRRDARLPPQRRPCDRAAALGRAADAHHVPLREGAAHAEPAAADGGRGARVARAGAGAGGRPLSGVSFHVVVVCFPFGRDQCGSNAEWSEEKLANRLFTG